MSSAVSRFLGGSPLNVFVRLVFVSLVVGALLVWLDITPDAIFRGIQRFLDRLWFLGFDAVREAWRYLLAGAAIVVPIWLVLRLLNMRSGR